MISQQAEVRDKEISQKLKHKRASLLMDGWQRHEKDIFNIIVGGNYILSKELKTQETTENIVEIFGPIINQIEKERECLIFNICTDHTNKAKAPAQVLCSIESGMIYTGCQNHSIALPWKEWWTTDTFMLFLEFLILLIKYNFHQQ